MTPALAERVRARLATESAEPTTARVAAAIRAEGVVLGDAAMLDLVRSLSDDIVGAGPLSALLAEQAVTDVLVNGPREVWVDRGRGLERSDAGFADEEQVRRLAQRLAARAGRRLDHASPFVDARMPDGVRLHAVLPPVAVGTTLISLRVPRRRPFSLDDLVAAGTVGPGGARLLRAIVATRVGFLVSGGTGCGKTTVLGSLLGLVDAPSRIVVVEDSTELAPAHPHTVRLQSRLPNIDGAGAVSVRDLVRQALRMRPDRVVVGEVRGAEVVDLLTAMNTGHEGCAGTVHANSAADVPVRLEALGLMAGLDRHALHALVAAGVDAIVHVAREADGRRVVASIHAIERRPDGLVAATPAFERVDGDLRAAGECRLVEDLMRHAGER